MTKTMWIFSIAIFALGCGGAKSETSTSDDAAKKDGKLQRIDDRSRCDTEGRIESLVDLNQDDTPDVRKVYISTNDSKVLICREADLNFDGIKDIFMFFDERGQITSDEIDLDYDGKIDIISTYAKGKVMKQEIDTNSDGIVDRVRALENDLPVRVEGDTDGNGQVDYWEYYAAGRLMRVGYDEDGDGRADRWLRDENPEDDQKEPEAENKEEGEDGGEEGNDENAEEGKEEAEE
jgi:hypothetical protein